MVSYSVSARGKNPSVPISDFLSENFNNARSIDSVFGFSYRCKLYGGRPFFTPELSVADLAWMEVNGVGYKIPVQNTVATEEDYYREAKFFQKFHKKGNSLILAKTKFAELVRRDFPDYELEASVIMKADSVEKVEHLLEFFDVVVPDPAWCANRPEIIPEELRPRVRLFANAGCMFTCPQRICYNAVSKMNLGVGEYRCSETEGVPRNYKGSMYAFPVSHYAELGFSKFKLLRSGGTTGW